MGDVSEVNFREPCLADAAAISDLIRRCPPLDVNSHYVSLLLCRDFAATCVVAEIDGQIAAFLSAYQPPLRNDTIFVWQVAVDESARSRHLASKMLDVLLRRDVVRPVKYLEATVTPSNTASQSLFQALARRHDTDCCVSAHFTAEDFDEGTVHEPEDLFRIGPFRSHATPTTGKANTQGATKQ